MNKENSEANVIKYTDILCRAGYEIRFSQINSSGIVISKGPLINDGKVNYEGVRGFIKRKEDDLPAVNPINIHCKDCPFETGCKVIYGDNGTIYSSQNSETELPEIPKTL